MTLMRTEYWNPSTGTIRTGATGHAESQIDVEEYLLPLDRIRNSSLHGWGVTEGLQVTAVHGQPDLVVTPGVGVDRAGRLIVLSAGGVAILDATVDPTDIQNIPTVTVPNSGPIIPTAGITGDCVLTMTWREVLAPGPLASAPPLLHAPWFRVVATTGFQDIGEQLVLAAVTLDANGGVTSMSTGTRRGIASFTGRVVLQAPQATMGGTPGVRQTAMAELLALADGSVQLNQLIGATSRPALSIDSASTDLVVAAGLRVAANAHVTGELGIGGQLTVSGGVHLSGQSGSRPFGLEAGPDGGLHVRDITRQTDILTIDPAGNIGVGISAGQAHRPLHVEGSEVHSGGPAGGFSFADRQSGGFVEAPLSGERWVLYSVAGTARLWSGTDRLSISPASAGGALRAMGDIVVGSGGNGALVARHVNGKNYTDDTDDDLYLNWGNGHGVHVGGLTRPNLWVHGNAIVGSSGNGVLTVRHINGKSSVDDTDDDLYLNWGTGRAVHIGGAAKAALQVTGDAVINGSLSTDMALWTKGGLQLQNGSGINGSGQLTVTSPGTLYLGTAGGVLVGAEMGGGNLFVQGRSPNGWPRDLPIPSWSGGGIGSYDIFSRGAVYVGSDVGNPAVAIYNTGLLKAKTKNFAIEHPLNPDLVLNHSCIEGPEIAVFYRGEGRLVAGAAVVSLPDYFEALARPETRTVVLTPLVDAGEKVVPLATTSVRDGRFTVFAADGSNPDQRFYWEVKATRTDVAQLVVVTEKRSAGREFKAPAHRIAMS